MGGDYQEDCEVEGTTFLTPVTKTIAHFGQALADKLGFKLSQLSLAWCLKNKNVSSVITGASRPEQVVDNVESLKLLTKLTPEIMVEIDELLLNKPDQDPARQD